MEQFQWLECQLLEIVLSKQPQDHPLREWEGGSAGFGV